MPPKKRTGPATASSQSSTERLSTSNDAASQLARLPLQHYLPRVALQLAAIGFCLATAAAKSPESSIRARIIDSLVHNPTGTLSRSILGVYVVQVWFAIWLRGLRFAQPKKNAAMGGKSTPANKEKKSVMAIGKEMFSNAMQGKPPHAELLKPENVAKDFGLGSLIPAAGITGVAALGLHACAVLLGASLFDKVVETFLLTFLVSTLAVLPLAVSIPISERFVWLRLVSELTPTNDIEFALLAPAVGTLFGCWAGAIPIPLDWDRPWQKWPTTCVIGAIFGHFIGSLVSVAVCSRRAARPNPVAARKMQ